MTAAREERKRGGPLNTKQYKIWMDVLETTDWLDVSTLAGRHNYTNREVTTAIGRMPQPPIIFDEGNIRFEGTPEDREYYRRVLTAERYSITPAMCETVLNHMTDEWVSVSVLAGKTGYAAVLISRTLVVVGDRISKKSTANGVVYRLGTAENAVPSP